MLRKTNTIRARDALRRKLKETQESLQRQAVDLANLPRHAKDAAVRRKLEMVEAALADVGQRLEAAAELVEIKGGKLSINGV